MLRPTFFYMLILVQIENVELTSCHAVVRIALPTAACQLTDLAPYHWKTVHKLRDFITFILKQNVCTQSKNEIIYNFWVMEVVHWGLQAIWITHKIMYELLLALDVTRRLVTKAGDKLVNWTC